MEKYLILIGFFEKQWKLIHKLHQEIIAIDLSSYEQRYVFALKAQQFFTAIEDLLKQITKAFENHINDLSSYHKELLIRCNTDIPNMRPAVLSKKSFLFLDKMRAFRHFIRHAYDCELEANELENIQKNLVQHYPSLTKDFEEFKQFIEELSES